MPTSAGLYDTSTLTYDTATSSYDGYPSPLANMPALGVYIGWVDGPYVAEPAWTDVSYLTRQITVRRGRQDDLQQFPSGQCSITFDNTQRLFDPFNTSGTWYAYLKPRRQIKIVAIWNGVSYPIFRGFVAGWPVEYTDGGLDSTVTVDCFDLIGLMAREITAAAWCETYSLSLNPTLFIRCAQLSNTYTDTTVSTYTRRYFDLDTVVNKTIYNKFQMSVLINDTAVGAQVGSCSQVATPAPGILTPALEVGANAGIVGVPGVSSAVATTGDLTFSCFISFTSTGMTYIQPVNVGAANGWSFWLYSQTNTSTPGLPYVRFFTTAGVNWSFNGTKRIMDSAVHHYAITVNTATSTITLYIDGEASGSVVYTGTLATTNFTQFGGGSIGADSKITYQHFALWEGTCLTPSQIATIARFGLNYYNQSAADRATFYLQQTPLSPLQYQIDTEMDSYVGEYQIGAQPLLPELQRLTQGDDGELFVNASGVMRLVDGDQYFGDPRSNTSQCTFTDTGVGVNYDASSIRVDLNADQVRNIVTVTGSQDIQVNVSDSTSTSTYGDAAENIDTRLATATDCNTLASRVLSLYKNPKMALDPFLVKGQANPTYNWPRLLALELLDRITFKRTPAVGSAIQKDLLVQSIEHRITPGTWETVVNGSTRYTGWFILGTSLLGSSEDVLL